MKKLFFLWIFSLFSLLSFADQSLIGGKATNLLILEEIPGIRVPKWFCIPAEVFQQYLMDNRINHSIGELDALCLQYQENEKEILALGAKIRKKISVGEIERTQLKELRETYAKLGNISVAVRSSGVLEDLATASFAGLYDSHLNIKGFKDVCGAVKQVWASSFNDRLIAERARSGIKQEKCLIAAIVQQMIPAQVSGVATSMELSSNYPGIEISANYGLGESTVGGEVSLDKWLVHPKNNFIIKSTLGSKNAHAVLLNRGIGTVKTTPSQQKKWALDNDIVLKIAKQMECIRSHYDSEIDIEFAIDGEGTLFFLQARPLVQVHPNKILVIDPEESKQHRVIAIGDYSVPGIAVGRLKFVEKWEDLAKKNVTIDSQDIVLTYVALNYWSHYLTRFKGLITKQGGPTTHPILLCRERQVPCLIGVGEDFENLRAYFGKIVTLDGLNRVIYEGEVKIKEAVWDDLSKVFEPVVVRKWVPFEQRIEELKKANCLIENQGQYWIRPSFPVRKFLQEIHLKCFERIPALLGQNEYKIEAKVLDNRVCWLLNSPEMEMRFFNRMSLEDCEKYTRDQEKNIREYLKITENFCLDPVVWQKYIDALVDLRAYLYFGETYRRYVDREAEKEAATLALPQYYFEECSAQIQAALKEEDTQMQQDIYELACKLCALPVVNDVVELKSISFEIFNEIETLGQNYRFDKNVSLEKTLDLNLVYKRLLGKVSEINEGKSFVTMKKERNTYEFFPQNPTLKRWLFLSISNRILQSNSHHLQMRGQWKVRRELIRLGDYLVSNGELKQSDEIFDLTPQEIKAHLTDYSISAGSSPDDRDLQ